MERSAGVLGRLVVLATLATLPGLAALAAPGIASAHTEADVVAVPAGEPAEIRLQPTHGCEGSPTVAVRIRAPFPDATAGEVEGWTATATPDGSGNTVLEWSGGVLPADEEGAFPVGFTAPDSPGTLLTFPAIQVCESGAELAWISGDPTDEYPAPRVLVLPAGSEPAETIDDVALDAPGRDQLVAVVDVDNPDAAPTTAVATPTTAAPAATITTAAAPPTDDRPIATVAPATTATSTPSSAAPPSTVDDDEGSSTGPLLGVGAVVVVAGGGAAALLARHRRPTRASGGGAAGDDGDEVGAGARDA